MRLRSNRVLPGRTDELSMFQQTPEWKEFKNNHAHMFAQTEKKPSPTFKEITEGADYTINNLRDTTYKHVCTQLLSRKATHIPGTLQTIYGESRIQIARKHHLSGQRISYQVTKEWANVMWAEIETY
mmetsp:Transcript_17760/g.26468  ORF Transcript_17760/g.26468 Transcript_17760/m.26468 type:complete len:127 (-) Transcript_17760:44-424(-)